MHLTDQELNEYLDKESANSAEIKLHLNSCDECTARLSDLQSLFTELESLPDMVLSTNIATRFTLRADRKLIPQLPRWLTLTTTLQVVTALIALIVVVPFLSVMLPQVEMPSFTTLFIHIQAQWMIFLDQLSTLALNLAKGSNLPTFQLTHLPALEKSTLWIALVSMSVLWIFGNGLLLRNRS